VTSVERLKAILVSINVSIDIKINKVGAPISTIIQPATNGNASAKKVSQLRFNWESKKNGAKRRRIISFGDTSKIR